MIRRDECAARDAADPLAPLRAEFELTRADAEGLIYLDGNSLGVLPRAALTRLADVAGEEWGAGLIRSWNTAGWITLAQRIGDKIARLIGARPGEAIVADSTSVNLYKALSAAIAISKRHDARRTRIVSERTNFPTDLYIADTIAREQGFELVLVDRNEIPDGFDHDVAIVMLTHVNYRTGWMHPMAEITRAVHGAGALMVWDLAHSAGAVPVNLYGLADEEAADFAVGCGYKYLNGGPGAPAFIWAHPAHTEWMDRERWRQPLSGWLGHAAPFAFETAYEPARGIARFVCGTPAVLSMAALECGVDTVLAADAVGGIETIRAKSIVLTDLFVALVEERCGGHGLGVATPLAPSDRGSQISLTHQSHGYEIVQALVARGVIGDFRAPDILRFGFTPLYTRFVDVWDAVDRLATVLASGEWRDPRYAVRAAVT